MFLIVFFTFNASMYVAPQKGNLNLLPRSEDSPLMIKEKARNIQKGRRKSGLYSLPNRPRYRGRIRNSVLLGTPSLM